MVYKLGMAGISLKCQHQGRCDSPGSLLWGLAPSSADLLVTEIEALLFLGREVICDTGGTQLPVKFGGPVEPTVPSGPLSGDSARGWFLSRCAGERGFYLQALTRGPQCVLFGAYSEEKLVGSCLQSQEAFLGWQVMCIFSPPPNTLLPPCPHPPGSWALERASCLGLTEPAATALRPGFPGPPALSGLRPTASRLWVP